MEQQITIDVDTPAAMRDGTVLRATRSDGRRCAQGAHRESAQNPLPCGAVIQALTPARQGSPNQGV